MKERINCYYKYSFGISGTYISGLKLPDPTKGPYKFIACDFHPAIGDDLKENYADSVIQDWNGKDCSPAEVFKY